MKSLKEGDELDKQQFEKFIDNRSPENASYWKQQYTQANNNEVEAMIKIALLYKEQSYYKEMYHLLIRAIEIHDDADALYELANCYFEELDNRGSVELAFHFYERAALKKHPDAINNLADMYLNGEGTVVNEEVALMWFTKAAEIGVVEAMYTLGIMYEQGLGTEENPKQALQYYCKAAAGGYLDAVYRIGMIHFSGELDQPQNEKEAMKWFLKGAEGFHVDAIYNMAYCYENGYGVKQSLEQAIRYYKQASLLGDVQSTEKLVELYEMIDANEATKWRKKASEQLKQE